MLSAVCCREDEVSDDDGDCSKVYLWHGYQDVEPQSFRVFKSPVIRVSVGLQVSPR